MNIEGFITRTKMEIEQLTESIFHVESGVSVRVLENAIEDRERAIKRVKEKYSLKE